MPVGMASHKLPSPLSVVYSRHSDWSKNETDTSRSSAEPDTTESARRKSILARGLPVHRAPRFLRDPTAASVRPTGILTCVGSVLRQWRLLLSSASPPSPPPCPPPSRLSPSPSPPLPHSLQSLFLSLPLLLTLSHPPPSSLALLGSAATSAPLHHRFFHPLLSPLSPLRVASCYSTTTTTSPPPPPPPPSASWPSPPAESTWWLPHHLRDPAPLSTNDQPLSLLRVPLFLRERNLSFLRSRAPLLSKPPSSCRYSRLS